jgi:hypothetical protein
VVDSGSGPRIDVGGLPSAILPVSEIDVDLPSQVSTEQSGEPDKGKYRCASEADYATGNGGYEGHVATKRVFKNVASDALHERTIICCFSRWTAVAGIED